MLSNYFTIRAVIAEVNQQAEGSKIAEIYTFERNRLTITLDNEKSTPGIVISCEPRLNYIFSRPEVRRAKRNVLQLIKDATGKLITAIDLYPTDRQITFSLEDTTRLIIQLFGPKANVLYTGADSLVLDSFLRPKELIGTYVPKPNEAASIPKTFSEFSSLFIGAGQDSLQEVLKKQLPVFGTILVRDLCLRAGVQSDIPGGQIRSDEITLLWNSYIGLLEDLDVPSPRIYYENDEPLALSIVHLQSYYGKPERPFASCSEAIRIFIRTSLRKKDIAKEKKEIGTRLTNELRKTERALDAAHEEISGIDRRALYEKFGTILMAHPDADTKGRNSIDLPDITADHGTLWIDIDPRLDSIRNAERYFNRARKARQSRIEAGRRIKSLEQRSEDLRSLVMLFDPIDDQKELKQFFRDNRKILDKLGIRMKKDTQQEIPFRVFTVAGDFEVWAGKNSANNDLLTMKFAKPHDLWFHARGSGGSHVVLKTAGSKAVVPKEAVEQAASIAAYYSRMRTSKLVPVTVTDRKYVRKRKGDPPGTVIVSREKVLMVEPKLPASAEGPN
jgi:predicted ribosome quality control (RQC) complex YloA/Tae2 family protein